MKTLLRILLCSAVSALCSATGAAQATPVAGAQTGLPGSAELQPDCEHGQGQNACEHYNTTFTKPNVVDGHGHRALEFQDLTTYGPSISFGHSGGWTITHVIEAPHIVFGTSGIDQYQSANVVKNGTGDLAGLYLYVYGGGRSAQEDEGVTGITVESGEINGYFHGTIASGAGPGSTSLTLTDTPSVPHDWKSTCDGCMLLDISKGKIAGNLNGKAAPLPGTFLMQLPTANVSVNGASSSLPLTRAWCTLTAAVPPTTTAGVGTSRTVGCTLGTIGGSTPSFRSGQIATIAGKFYPEQVMITNAGQPSGGVQTLTFAARNPNPAGSLLFQGGIAGQSLSFDDNLALTGFRTSYYVFGSLDGTNLIYGSQIAGNVAGNILPRRGSDAETITSGFHLYPSAEIVANSAQPSAPTLEPNAVPWEAGDTVEDPRFQSYGGTGIRDVCAAVTPSDEGVASGCMYLELGGPGISGTYHPFRMTNHNQPSLYTQAGGKLAPVPAFFVDGPFGDLMTFGHGPSTGIMDANAVINITHTFNNDNTPFNLFALPSGHVAGTTTVTYDPATHLIGFPQGLVAGTLGTLTDCASAAPNPNCGQSAAGSIAIQPGATKVVVVTSKVTAASEILITPDTSLGAKLGISCNQNLATAFTPYGITARVPGHAFTLSLATPANAANCYSFTIVN
jgi:hypothetical protein